MRGSRTQTLHAEKDGAVLDCVAMRERVAIVSEDTLVEHRDQSARTLRTLPLEPPRPIKAVQPRWHGHQPLGGPTRATTSHRICGAEKCNDREAPRHLVPQCMNPPDARAKRPASHDKNVGAARIHQWFARALQRPSGHMTGERWARASWGRSHSAYVRTAGSQRATISDQRSANGCQFDFHRCMVNGARNATPSPYVVNASRRPCEATTANASHAQSLNRPSAAAYVSQPGRDCRTPRAPPSRRRRRAPYRGSHRAGDGEPAPASTIVRTALAAR